MTVEPYRNDLIDNCNSCAGDVVELFGDGEHTVNDLQRLDRRT
jgi:hypothetical protein